MKFIQGLEEFRINQWMLWVLILSVMSLHPVHAQTESEEELLESYGKEHAAGLLEEMQELRENPIDINRAGVEELQRIPFITQVLIHSIIRQRKEKGSFRSLQDFRSRLHIEPELWLKIKPYISIKKNRFRDISLQVRSRFQRNYSNQIDYNSLYPGSAWKMYQRIKVYQEDIFTGGLLIEKDAGETQLIDHLAGFIEFNNVYKNIRLLFGNYYLKSGQGLIAWSPYGFSKGAYPVYSVKKNASGFRGYTSTDENNYLTGGAADITLGAFRFLLFASGTRLDASFNEDGTVKSFPTSGYHRTEYEKKSKQRVTEGLGGIRATVTTKYGEVGASYLTIRYSHTVKKNSGEKNLFSFTGHRNFLAGLDFDLCFDRCNVFGEIAGCGTNSTALLTGCVFDVHRVRGVLIYRNFSPRFYNPHGQGFGSSSVRNETGINVGLSVKIYKYKINMMFDFYTRPWRSYFTPVPVSGDDLYLWITRRIIKQVKMKCIFKFKRKEDYDTYTLLNGIPSEILKTQHQNSIQLDILSKFHQIKLKSRIALNHIYDTYIQEEWGYKHTNETGFLFFQDMDFASLDPLHIRFRWVRFKTDSYVSRIYEFENDLPGSFSIPFLYGEGYRWYVITQIKIKKHLEVTVKYRETRMSKSSVIDEGREVKRYLGLQADLKF